MSESLQRFVILVCGGQRRAEMAGRAPKAEQDDLFEIGDELFFLMGSGTAAGEALYIGHAPGNARLLVLAKRGMPGTDFDAADCTPTGRKDQALGHKLRKAHLERFPGSMT